MTMKIKIYPEVDFLHAFLMTRGMVLVDDSPQVLHYTGTSLKELKTLLKKDNPDLLVFHSKSFYKFLSSFHEIVFWVYQPINKEKDLYQTKTLYTNSEKLCQLYYQKLGIQADIKVIPRKKKKKREINLASPIGQIKTWWSKFCVAMYWK